MVMDLSKDIPGQRWGEGTGRNLSSMGGDTGVSGEGASPGHVNADASWFVCATIAPDFGRPSSHDKECSPE